MNCLLHFHANRARLAALTASLACLLVVNFGGRASAADTFSVGDRVLAEPGDHPATILEITPSKTAFRVHYEDNSQPDSWLEIYLLKKAVDQKRLDGQTAKGPRVGKYLMYAYGSVGTTAVYIGYFELQAGGKYHVYLPGGKDAGNGKYSFDKVGAKVRWEDGPFAGKDWDGTQKFEVSREGKTHIIRLKRNTIGTNSTDSKVK